VRPRGEYLRLMRANVHIFADLESTKKAAQRAAFLQFKVQCG
jgi:hypothetical protein